MTECIARMQQCDHLQIGGMPETPLFLFSRSQAKALGKRLPQESFYGSLLFTQSTLDIRSFEVRQTSCQQLLIAADICAMSAQALIIYVAHGYPLAISSGHGPFGGSQPTRF